jgi:sulfate/thiosulfate transport system substrate-binding protein
MSKRLAIILFTLSLPALTGCGSSSGDDSPTDLLNVSYDPTRELWQDVNKQFLAQYEKDTGIRLTIRQSHGGSSNQARSVIEGLEADVVTLALHSDTDAIRKGGLINEGWEEHLPNHSLPYFSTIVFVVRQGNPNGVRDWPDLIRGDVKVVTPNPRTSGNGKLSFLAAWGSVINAGGDEEAARSFVTELYRHVPVLDAGARGATLTFSEKKVGDVHLTWENEAYLEVKESKGSLEIIYPPSSIRAEPFVAVVDENVDRKKSRPHAEAYLRFLYTLEAQETLARHHYRPINEGVLKRHENDLSAIRLFTVSSVAQDWNDSDRKFFKSGAIFDQVAKSIGK